MMREFDTIPSMTIEKVWFHDLQKSPRELNGTVVVIDAQAATANMAILLSKKPRRIIVVNEENLGRARQTYPDGLLIGESNALPESAFTWDNHQQSMYESSPKGRDLLWMSINGSRLIEFALAHTKEANILAGSFINARAIADYSKEKHLPVTIIMAGDQGVEVVEDRISADVIEHYIDKTPFDWESLKKKITNAFRTHYAQEVLVDIPFLVDHLNEFSIVPKCVINPDGFIEIRAVV